MKKSVFILVAVLLCGTVANSQNISDTLFNDYFLPDYIDVDSCGYTNFYSTDDIYCNLARGHYFFYTTGYGVQINHQNYSGVLDRAQPCYTDTLLTIKGIAIGVNNMEASFYDYVKLRYLFGNVNNTLNLTELYNTKPKGKLRVMDSTLSREITSIDIDTNYTYIDTEFFSYMEYYFENSVNVNGLFYIVEDVLPTSTRLHYVVATDCYFEYPSLVRTAEWDTLSPWVQWEEHIFNTLALTTGAFGSTYQYLPVLTGGSCNTRNECQMYFFPIFAETDSTLGNDSTDMSLYDVNVDRYSNIYPNPAKDIVTVQSSFKVREIEIHNALGQVVLRKEGSQNIETIDVSNLQSGAYIVRIKTQRGFANKKILIE
jgi:hypothetical protein